MDREEIKTLFQNIAVWRRGGEPAPHKVLLVLFALGRCYQGKGRLTSYADVDDALKGLLLEFGADRSNYRTEYPFWRLQSDGIWQLQGAEKIKPNVSGDVKKTDLLRLGVQGGFTEEIYLALCTDRSLLLEITDIVLNAYSPRTMHDAILQAVGIYSKLGGSTSRGLQVNWRGDEECARENGLDWQPTEGEHVTHFKYGAGIIEQTRGAGSQLLVCFDKENRRWVFRREVVLLKANFSDGTELTTYLAPAEQSNMPVRFIEHPIHGRGEILSSKDDGIRVLVHFLNDGSKRWIKRKDPESSVSKPLNESPHQKPSASDELLNHPASDKVLVDRSKSQEPGRIQSVFRKIAAAWQSNNSRKEDQPRGKSPGNPKAGHQKISERTKSDQDADGDIGQISAQDERLAILAQEAPSEATLRLLPIFLQTRIDRFSYSQMHSGYQVHERISKLPLAVRIKQYLNVMGFEVLGELLLAVPKDLLEYRYFSEAHLHEVQKCIWGMLCKPETSREATDVEDKIRRGHETKESIDDRMIALSDISPREESLKLLPLFSSRPIEFFTSEELHPDYKPDAEIPELRFSPRVNRFLNAMGFNTLGKLLLTTPSELFEYQYFKSSDLREVEKVVKSFILSRTAKPSKHSPVPSSVKLTNNAEAAGCQGKALAENRSQKANSKASQDAPLMKSQDAVCIECDVPLIVLQKMLSRKVRRLVVWEVEKRIRTICEESCRQIDEHRQQITDRAFIAKLFARNGGYYILQTDQVVATSKLSLEKHVLQQETECKALSENHPIEKGKTRASNDPPLLRSQDPVCIECDAPLVVLQGMLSRKLRRLTVWEMEKRIRTICEESCRRIDEHRHQIIDRGFMAKLFARNGGYYILERDGVVATARLSFQKQVVQQDTSHPKGGTEECNIPSKTAVESLKFGSMVGSEVGVRPFTPEKMKESKKDSAQKIRDKKRINLGESYGLKVGLILIHQDFGKGRVTEVRRGGGLFRIRFEEEKFDRWLWTKEHEAKMVLNLPGNIDQSDTLPADASSPVDAQNSDFLMESVSELTREVDGFLSETTENDASNKTSVDPDSQHHNISFKTKRMPKIKI